MNQIKIIALVLVAMFTFSVSTAQKNKKKKDPESSVPPATTLAITGASCVNCMNDLSNYDYSTFRKYVCDSSGRTFYYLLNDTIAEKISIPQNVAGIQSEYKFSKSPTGLLYGYVDNRNNINPMLGGRTFLYKSSFLKGKDRPVYDTVRIINFREGIYTTSVKFIFPYSNPYDVDTANISSSYEGCAEVYQNGNYKVLIVMSYYNKNEKKQTIKGYLFDRTKLSTPIPEYRKLDIYTANSYFSQEMPAQYEYPGGKSVYSIISDATGENIALGLYGRNDNSILLFNAAKNKYKIIEKAEQFTFTSDGKLLYLFSDAGKKMINEFNCSTDSLKNLTTYSNYELRINEFRFAPGGNYYTSGDLNSVINMKTGQRHWLTSLTEEMVGEEPVRKQLLSAGPYGQVVEKSNESFDCVNLAFTPDGKSVIAIYRLTRKDFKDGNRIANAEGKFEIEIKNRWYVVLYALPE